MRTLALLGLGHVGGVSFALVWHGVRISRLRRTQFQRADLQNFPTGTLPLARITSLRLAPVKLERRNEQELDGRRDNGGLGQQASHVGPERLTAVRSAQMNRLGRDELSALIIIRHELIKRIQE